MIVTNGYKYLTSRKNWTDPSRTDLKPEKKGWIRTLWQRSKTIFKEHKLLATGVYGTIHLTGLGAFYLAFANNVLDVSMIGVEQIEAFSDMADSASESIFGVKTNFSEMIQTDFRFKCGAFAFIANEFLEPMRIGGVVVLTPPLAARLARKPPPPPYSPPPPPPPPA